MKVAKLGEICEMYQPKTISTKEMVSDGKYTVFGANGAIGKYDKYNHESPQLLVTCRGATCGSVNISEPFSWINGNAMVIKPKENLATFDYLKYAFLGGINISGAITGSAQPQITRTTLEQILIPIPSIDYQCLAVEKLDKAFAEIDSLEKNLQSKEEKTNQLLQSVLSAAFTNTKDIDMKATHETGTIDELCHVEYGTRVVRKRDAGSTYPVYGGGGETFYLDSFNRENRVVIARFAMSEKCTRKVLGKFALNDSGLTLSPKNVKSLRQDYLDYWILSLNDVIYEKARGTAQKNLDMATFRKIHLTFPRSMQIQKRIVEKLDKAFAEIDDLRNQVSIEKERISSLRQSILSNTFNFEEKAA